MATGSFIAVTPGSGAKLATGPTYTENANVVQDEKVIVGEQYVATYSVSTGPNMGTLNSHLCQIMAGASLKLRVRRIELYPAVSATTVTLDFLTIWRLTSAGTGGIALTINPFDSTDAAVGATAMATPTVKGTEGALLWQGSFVAYQTLPTSGAIQPPIIIDLDGPRRKPIIVPAGTANGIAIKNGVAIANASVLIQIYFDEVPF